MWNIKLEYEEIPRARAAAGGVIGLPGERKVKLSQLRSGAGAPTPLPVDIFFSLCLMRFVFNS